MTEPTSGAEALVGTVRRLAEREAAAHLVHPVWSAWADHPATTVAVQVRPCPVCTAVDDPSAQPVRSALAPVREVRVLADGEPVPEGASTLVALSCEAVTGRSLVALAVRAGPAAPTVQTRAVRVAELGAAKVTALPDVVAALDASEAWFDGDAGPGPWTLPTSARHRLRHPPLGTASPPGPHGATGLQTAGGGMPLPVAAVRARLRTTFASHHLDGPGLALLEMLYRRRRLAVVSAAVA